MIRFRDPDDRLDKVREAPATTPPALHGMQHLCRHDQLPRILVKHLTDGVFDLSLSDDVAGADEHFPGHSGTFHAAASALGVRPVFAGETIGGTQWLTRL